MTTNNNMIGSYCLSEKVTRVTPHRLYYSMFSKCPLQQERKRVDGDAAWHYHIQ